MKSKYYLSIVFLIVFFSTCALSNKEFDSEPIFVKYSIPISYDTLLGSKEILLNVIVNQDDTIKALFDTGCFGIVMASSYENKYFKLKDSLHIQVGTFKSLYTGNVRFYDTSIPLSIKRETGKDGIVIGWDFFKDEIIEISYKNRTLKILDNIQTMRYLNYDSIKYTILKNKLIIPIALSIQQKRHLVNGLIDTGFNGCLISTEDIITGLNLAEADSVYGTFVKQKFVSRTLFADTIKVANSFIVNPIIAITDENVLKLDRKTKGEGLLGNSFFENFSVIIDFPNQNLYLKSISEEN